MLLKRTRSIFYLLAGFASDKLISLEGKSVDGCVPDRLQRCYRDKAKVSAAAFDSGHAPDTVASM